MKRGRIVFETHESLVLQDNRLGDPSVRTFPVYLPPGYDEGTKRHPVVYVLAGFTGTGRMFLSGNPWSPGLDERMDRLIAEGSSAPMILVMPDCFTRYGGSQYLNSETLGRYEDLLVDELVPWIDERYRTIPEREARGVIGKSSGGYGAIRLAMRRPDVFGAVACHSGDMDFESCYRPDFYRFLAEVQRHGGTPERWFEAFEAKPKKESKDILALNILAMSAAYSANPERAPLMVDFPFDLETAEIDPAVWARWLENDPVHMVESRADALKRMSLVFVDCGSRDNFNLHHGARILRRKLERLGIPHEYEEFDDDHMSVSYRFDVSLPKMAKALGAR